MKLSSNMNCVGKVVIELRLMLDYRDKNNTWPVVEFSLPELLIRNYTHGSAWARFNIKMSSYRYRKPIMVVRSSNLHNGISYTGKMTFLYWIRSSKEGPWRASEGEGRFPLPSAIMDCVTSSSPSYARPGPSCVLFLVICLDLSGLWILWNVNGMPRIV